MEGFSQRIDQSINRSATIQDYKELNKYYEDLKKFILTEFNNLTNEEYVKLSNEEKDIKARLAAME